LIRIAHDEDDPVQLNELAGRLIVDRRHADAGAVLLRASRSPKVMTESARRVLLHRSEEQFNAAREPGVTR